MNNIINIKDIYEKKGRNIESKHLAFKYFNKPAKVMTFRETGERFIINLEESVAQFMPYLNSNSQEQLEINAYQNRHVIKTIVDIATEISKVGLTKKIPHKTRANIMLLSEYYERFHRRW